MLLERAEPPDKSLSEPLVCFVRPKVPNSESERRKFKILYVHSLDFTLVILTIRTGKWEQLINTVRVLFHRSRRFRGAFTNWAVMSNCGIENCSSN